MSPELKQALKDYGRSFVFMYLLLVLDMAVFVITRSLYTTDFGTVDSIFASGFGDVPIDRVWSSQYGWHLLHSLPAALFLSAPVLIFGGAGRWLLLAEGLFIFVTDTAQAVTYHLACQTLSGDILWVLMATSWEQCVEFASVYFSWRACLGILLYLSAFSWLLLRGVGKASARPSRESVLLGVILLCPWLYGSYLYPYQLLNDSSCCASFWWDTFAKGREYQQLLAILDSPELPSDLRLAAPPSPPMLGVIVVGESASRNHSQLYGYDRPNNPEMNAIRDQLLLYTKVNSTTGVTSRAMGRLFTQKTANSESDYKCSLVDVLQTAGYKVHFLSAHLRWGHWDGTIAPIFAHADNIQYLSVKAGHFITDDQLLPAMDDAIAATQASPTIVILHVIGSHSDFKERFPPEFARFTLASPSSHRDELTQPEMERLNDYDNTILFTDYVLGQVVKRLENTGRPAFMLYISDHGEFPLSDEIRLANLDKCMEIPFFIWCSQQYKKIRRDFMDRAAANLQRPFTSDLLFWGLIDLAYITTPDLKPENNFLAPDFTPQR